MNFILEFIHLIVPRKNGFDKITPFLCSLINKLQISKLHLEMCSFY